MKNPTFKDDGMKRIECPCGHFICETRLTDDRIRIEKCHYCGTRAVIHPPKKGDVDGQKVIFHGPNNGLWTADLTDEELRNSV